MIRIVRHTFTATTTIGTWYFARAADERPFCWTLEDHPVLAIPPGVHTLELSHSPKFGRTLPHIYSATIPPERGIRVHRGSNHTHTLGCVLVGFSTSLDTPAIADQAEDAIVDALEKLGGKVMIEIVEVRP